MHKQQGWTEETEAGRREIRATRAGRDWRIQSRLKGERAWTYHDPPLLHDLESLHQLLLRKLQRRRCSVKEVEDVARLVRRHPDHEETSAS